MQSPGQEPAPGPADDPLTATRARLVDGSAVVAGVLSGTSADGIDVALVRFDEGPPPGRPRLLAFETRPFPGDLGHRVRTLLDGRLAGRDLPDLLGRLARMDRDLGHAFGAAARETADRQGLALDLVASHGQTVWHHDGRAEGGPATLQLGDGCHVAFAADCPVASDFRRADVAAGGEGAPLSALADGCVFAGVPRPLAVLNLGGLSNLTVLPEGDGPVLAFDTGPCGSLLDGLARRLLGRDLDRDGERAACGNVRGELVSAWLAHPFIDRPPPKSTGRDTFGEAWIDELLAGAGEVPAEDLLRTAVELAAACVAEGVRRFLPASTFARPESALYVAGGGIHHPVLLDALAERTGLGIASTAELGVDPDAREALVFAVLGARCALGLPSMPAGSRGPTGAHPGRVLGKLSPGAAPGRP